MIGFKQILNHMFCHVLAWVPDSRHFQLAIYTVFNEESESAVRIDQILHPEEKMKKNRPMRVSISYRKISYYTSPLFFFVFLVITRDHGSFEGRH